MHRPVYLMASIFLVLALCASYWPADGPGSAGMSPQGCDPDMNPPVIVYPSQDINVQLAPCDGSRTAVVFFDATASDACDPSPALSINVSASPGGSLQLSNPFQNTYMALATPGTYQLILTATDASGNTREEDFFIVVTQPPAPVANAACNSSVVINLGPGCQRYVSADMLLTGEVGCLPDASFLIEIEDEDPSNGNILDGVGVFPFSITPLQPPNATNFTGPFALSDWGIHVDFQGSVVLSATADSLVLNGSLSTASAIAVLPMQFNGALSFRWGTAFLPPGALFEGFLLGPAGNIITSFSSADGSSGLENLFINAGSKLVLQLFSNDQGGGGPAPVAWLSNWNFDYAPVSLAGVPSCWGEIDARDAGPVLECPDDTDSAPLGTSAQQLAGELDVTDPILNPPLYSCLIENAAPAGGRFYELIPFEVTETDIYTFFLESGFNEGFGHLALFQDTFDLNNPCQNIIAQADNPQVSNPIGTGNDPVLRIGLPLQAGRQYYLLTTSDIPDAIGPYTYTVVSDGDGQILGVPSSQLDILYPLYCNDVGLVLDDTASLSLLGVPDVQGGCTPFAMSFSDVLTEEGDCGALYITRTFTAVDEQGNTGTCEQRIDFHRPSLDEVVLPPFTFPVECDEAYPVDSLGNPAPELTGYPFLVTASGIVDLRDAYCNIGATYEDGPQVDNCGVSHSFVRKWTIIDWCIQDFPLVYDQIIRIGDFTGPEVSCTLIAPDGTVLPDPPVYSTNPFFCTATFAAPLPEVSDNCSSWEVTTEIVTDESTIIYGPSGNAIDTVVETVVLATVLPDAPSRIVSNIPVGCHRFRFTVEDECGNETVSECGFCVEDQVRPNVTCDDNLGVSIGSSGTARIFGSVIEEDSWDNCGIEKIEVRREVSYDDDCNPVPPYFTPWAEYVDFFCCDANSIVEAEVRVVDAAGNEGICSVSLLVEDKSRPSCTPPDAYSLYCDELPYDFTSSDTAQLQSLFGEPEVADNCGAFWNELTPVNNLDDCGYGTIIRRFEAVDINGNTSNTNCEQVITILEKHNYEIKFPKDDGANCGYPNPADTIEVSEIGCDLLAISVDDLTLSTSGDECYKLFRTYRVVNWCEYDGQSSPVVIGRDEDCDGMPGDEDVWVLRRQDHAYIDRDNQENNADPVAGERLCQPDNPEGYWRNVTSNGYWEYTQHLKIYDTIPPQILFIVPPPFCAISDDCLAAVEYLFIVSDNCTPDDLNFEIYYDENSDGVPDSMVTTIFGVYPKWKINGEYPIGTHSFEVYVRDGCGNVATASMPFEVVDCKAPSPTCISGLVSTLMGVPPDTDVDNDGDIDLAALTIFASDFIASPVSDCSGPVIYSINRPGEEPSPDKQSLILTCDDMGILIVEIHAWDHANNPYAVQPDDLEVRGPNHDHCETFILVRDNGQNCLVNEGLIAGQIQREDNQPVAEVEVALGGDVTASTLTADDGLYAFNALELGYDYTITPYRDGDDHNGLSTFDIVLISQHILGTRPLDSPYKIIAADVNRSGSVSTIDMIQLRQLILGIILEFPTNDSWRFVPRSHNFDNPRNPWTAPIPESISINNLNGQRLTEDFVGIKVGDVDLSAQANGLQGVEGRRYPGTLSLRGADVSLQAGEQYVLTLQSDLDGILGLQAALRFDTKAVSVGQVIGEAVGDQYFNRQYLEDGRLILSWNTPAAAHTDAALMSIHLRARKACRLSEVASLDENLLAAEAYDENYQKIGLHLDWEERPARGPGLYNWPNPFHTKTTIRFEAAEAGPGRLELYHLNGALVKSIEGFYTEGVQQIEVSAAELPAPGVYICKLQFGGQSWAQKLVFTGR
ncbi:MAG: T9SS type A sorting domain-containing protein [Lewinellaceae bacterium]|nr:T9SS type A sorting domain-containing protein [Lewinellaceae bacterium]